VAVQQHLATEASEPGTGGSAAAAAERGGTAGSAGSSQQQQQQQQAVYDALAQLPYDLGFSPPSPGPAGRLRGGK
jgi:hypothetical protein